MSYDYSGIYRVIIDFEYFHEEKEEIETLTKNFIVNADCQFNSIEKALTFLKDIYQYHNKLKIINVNSCLSPQINGATIDYILD